MNVSRSRAVALLCVAVLAACNMQTAPAAMVTAVKAKLATVDPDSTTAVRVTATADGVVTLTGDARDSAQRSAYDSAAASVSGVKRVVDRIRINPALHGPKETFQETALGAKVAANIAAQAGVNAANVKPEVHGDVVTLAGRVSSASVKTTILDTARKTNGVSRVIDRIEVKP